MLLKEFLQYNGFCAPIISSLGCAIMLVLFRHTHAKSEEGTLHRLLVSYFLLVSLGWICSLVYVYLPLLYVRINILYYLIVFWSQVVFYQFIYTLTRLPRRKTVLKNPLYFSFGDSRHIRRMVGFRAF